MPRRILISAGEASGDVYAALLVDELRHIWPDAQFFGCTGPRMRRAGVETVVDSASLAVVGLIEVISHIARIYGEFRKLESAARRRSPDRRTAKPSKPQERRPECPSSPSVTTNKTRFCSFDCFR